MKVVTYHIELLEPVLVTALEGDPNSAVSHNYLPGSVLRGMLIGLEIRHTKKELDITDDVVRRRFFSNQTRFLNGYLVINDGVDDKRSLPTPRTWDKPKYPNGATNDEITDRALAGDTKELSETGRAKTKPVGGFVVYKKKEPEPAEIIAKKPEHVINIHTLRDRKFGRSTNAAKNAQNTTNNNAGQNSGISGAIYRYDALQAGQIFEARILCDSNDDVEKDAQYFVDLLTKYPRGVIGGARTAGYGRVEISDVKIVEYEREVGKELLKVSDNLVITFLSDVILRDSNGQYSPDAETLLAVLRNKLSSIAIPDFDRVFKSETTVGGFNRKWGLPLPQVQALEMGSVFVIDVSTLNKQILLQELEKLEQQGIGERRNEGFGRIAIGWQQHKELTGVEEESKKAEVAEVKESADLWKRMTDRIERERTDRKQLAEANRLIIDKEVIPPNSQLNRLRQLVTTALVKATPEEQPNTDPIVDFFENKIKGKRAGEHFNKAKIGNQSMTEWVTTKAKETDKYAALRLIDAMLARAVKERKNG